MLYGHDDAMGTHPLQPSSVLCWALHPQDLCLACLALLNSMCIISVTCISIIFVCAVHFHQMHECGRINAGFVNDYHPTWAVAVVMCYKIDFTCVGECCWLFLLVSCLPVLHTGRVASGRVKVGDKIRVLQHESQQLVDQLKITRIEKRAGVGKVQLQTAAAGDIVSVAGAGDAAGIADTIAAPSVTEALDPGHIDPPTIRYHHTSHIHMPHSC